MSNNNYTAEEERALDAMLDEALGGARPPDLSSEILARYYNTAPQLEKAFQPPRSRRTTRGNNSHAKQVAAIVVTVTALAAMFAGLILLQPDHDVTDNVTEIVENARDNNENRSLASTVDAEQEQTKTEPDRKKSPRRNPPKGIPMMVQTPDSNGVDVDESPNEPHDVNHPDESQAAELALVSVDVKTELESYWEAVGIDPTAEATAEETVERLREVLGTELPVDTVGDPDRLEAELAQSLNAEAIAARWLSQITSRRSRSMDAKKREALISELADCIQTGSRFDEVILGWLSGTSGNSGAFLTALASGPRSAGGEHAMARSLAALTLNVDVRCTRCHDSYIEGSGKQKDYWNFVAFLNRGVKKGAGGEYSVRVGDEVADPVFYELSDGRQRVATPLVSPEWIAAAGSDGYQRMQRFARGLVGSPQLASGVVNSLWQLVHGQPLRGRVVDPISAPHNEALQRLEDKLTQDLVESRFDLARTLALIIASPASRRSVPESLLPENVWVADQSETDAAMNAVDAFAAALPPRVPLTPSQRVDQVLRGSGAQIESISGDALAQIDEGGTAGKAKNSTTLAADFPVKTELLPVQWLKLIEDRNRQIEHLGYLSGQNEVPAYVQESVKAMVKAEVEPNLLLHRAWWLMKP